MDWLCPVVATKVPGRQKGKTCPAPAEHWRAPSLPQALPRHHTIRHTRGTPSMLAKPKSIQILLSSCSPWKWPVWTILSVGPSVSSVFGRDPNWNWTSDALHPWHAAVVQFGSPWIMKSKSSLLYCRTMPFSQFHFRKPRIWFILPISGYNKHWKKPNIL